MDWQKLLTGAAVAFIGGAAAAFAVAAEGGVTTEELWIVLGAGLAALALYLKDPNSHRGPDKRQNGSANPFKK
jgi:hypothetical protein